VGFNVPASAIFFILEEFSKRDPNTAGHLVEETMIALGYDHGGRQVENRSGKKMQTND
jgi:hypothetical protein